MARPLRVEREGGWHHITARGNERRAIYRDERDREHFCQLLGQAVDQFRWRIHVFMLMDNHYHLLLETQEANLSKSMQWLNISYSVWFNRRHHRSGHLFQGRFKAISVDPMGWGLELSRYVHLNPVRVRGLGLDKATRSRDRLGVGAPPDAQMVRARIGVLRRYRWSSYRAYIGLEPEPNWLTCGPVRGLVGGRPGKKQREAYREHVESAVRQGLRESPWERLTAQVLLGGAEFVQAMRGQVRGEGREQTSLRQLRSRPSFTEAVAVVEGLKKEPWEKFRDRYGDWGRDMALYLGRRLCGLPLKELAAAAGGLDYSSAGTAIKRLERRLATEPKLARLLAAAQAALKNDTMSNAEI